MMRFPIGIGLLLGVFAGCTSGGGTPCVAGQSIACSCSTGATGSQTCQANGTYAACSCSGMNPGDGGADGGSLDGSANDLTSSKKRVFVTSVKVAGGDLDGPLQADGRCETAATNANLSPPNSGPPRWRAWLSGSSENAIDRITNVGPWYLVDGSGPVFNNTGDLTGDPLIAINLTEYGVTLNGPVWTGTASDGTKTTTYCKYNIEWDDAGNFTTGGTTGLSSATDAKWTQNATTPCTSTASIYCFEQ